MCRSPVPSRACRLGGDVVVEQGPVDDVGQASLQAAHGLVGPGTSKWNKIEHRLFSQISMNWRGQPLTSHEVIVNLIAGTTTRTGLTVTAELDDTIYPKGLKITDREMRDLETQHLTRHDFHGEWNYVVRPSTEP